MLCSSAAAADGDSLRPPRRVPPALFEPELTRADHLRLVRRKKIAKKGLRPGSWHSLSDSGCNLLWGFSLRVAVTLLQSRVRMRQERPRFDVDEDDAAVLPSSPLAVVQSSTTAAVTNTSEDELDEATLKLGPPSTPDDEGFAALMHCLSDEEEEVGKEDKAPEVPSVLTVVASEDKNPRKRKIGKSSNRLAEWMEGWANS